MPMIAALSSLFLVLALCWGSPMVNGYRTTKPCKTNPHPAGLSGSRKRPNILFVIMDDAGIDQFTLFGYGGPPGETQIETPTLNALAAGGITFHNTWSDPECSPSRTSMLTGRYSIRTNVTAAINSPELAGNQLNPYELTIPTILRKYKGYESVLIGKSHYAVDPGGEYNTVPYGGTSVTQAGWGSFYGLFGGSPPPIDTTAGGIAATNTYSCGYVPSLAVNSTIGADSGACYFIDGRCQALGLTPSYQSPGMECMTRGGIFVPNAACTSPAPSNLAWAQSNCYYANEYVAIPKRKKPYKAYEDYPPDSPYRYGRGYLTTIQANDCIEWIKCRSGKKPWFATLSFSAPHGPLQPAPLNLVYDKTTASLPATQTCSEKYPNTQLIFKTMVEAMDKELGRVLVETRIATSNTDGTINYDPKASNTVVVVVSDNGSWGNTVKPPFDPARSKGSVYQTGVWVPLIVSGPMVVQPNRQVSAMVNIVDLFQLFGEIAGVDVRKAVPKVRALDCKPLMPYLTNPTQTPIRVNNFAYIADNNRSPDFNSGACDVLAIQACTLQMSTQANCQKSGGIWYGPGSTVGPSSGFTNCCELSKYLAQNGQAPLNVAPPFQKAIRNAEYKYITYSYEDYDNSTQACMEFTVEGFYQINEDVPVPTIEHPTGPLANNLLNASLTPVQQTNLDSLKTQLQEIFTSATPCPGDVNMDGKVNLKDLVQQNQWMKTYPYSTWFDMNLDGFTNTIDVTLLRARMGTKCVLPR